MQGTAAADQCQVWLAIADKSERLQTHSPTAAMSDLFVAKDEHLEDYVRAIQPVDRQIGAIFSIDRRPRGLDLFDSARTCATLLANCLRERTRAEQFLKMVVGAKRVMFPAVGLGESRRFMGPDVSGGPLTLGGRIVHLSAFSLGSGIDVESTIV